MRNLLVLAIVLVGGFILAAMYVAPTQPALRDWYDANACPQLDKLSTEICAPLRRARTTGEERT